MYGDARADGHMGRLNKTLRRQANDHRTEAVAVAFGDAFGGVAADTCLSVCYVFLLRMIFITTGLRNCKTLSKR